MVPCLRGNPNPRKVRATVAKYVIHNEDLYRTMGDRPLLKSCLKRRGITFARDA